MRIIQQPDWRKIGELISADEADAEQWQRWSPREEIAPQFGRLEGGVLEVRGRGDGTGYGSWRRVVPSVRPGAAYRLTATCRVVSVAAPAQSVFVRLHWLDGEGGLLRPVDNAIVQRSKSETTLKPSAPPTVDANQSEYGVDYRILAPEGAHGLIVELGLRWSAGSIRWEEARLFKADHLSSRFAKFATVFHRPKNTGSPAESVASFCNLIESMAPPDVDLVCLPEGISLIGTGRSYADVAETVPGPTTEALGALARRRNCHIVAGVYERVGHCIYNTAVLIGRGGQLIGTYRKTHLPQEESDQGLTPGDSYPVFQTDFGTIGIMVCWDLQFPEPARALAQAGAEAILLPIWGGSEVLARARAIENHVFLVSSSYDMRTMMVDPSGRVLAEASVEQPLVTAEVDLDDPILQLPWLGDMRCRTWTERRFL